MLKILKKIFYQISWWKINKSKVEKKEGKNKKKKKYKRTKNQLLLSL